jgi:hypothetical protein
LIEHLLLATLSVTVLIAIFMGFRASLVVAIAIPVTLALTLAIYYFMGYTLNRVTLFALIFSIGILVDDAIVVVENIERHLKKDSRDGLVRATIRAVNEVGNPTILATFTVIGAILPMAFVRGLMGPYMKPIPVGASDIPYIFTRGVLGKDKITGVPFWPALVRFLRHLENDVSWAAAPIILAVGAWLPIIFARDSDSSIVAHQLPVVARWIQTLASVGILSSVYVAFKILPKRPERYKKSRHILMWLQWILIPVTGLLYGSTTGFNAQTRLMLGKRLEKFDETEKFRKD